MTYNKEFIRINTPKKEEITATIITINNNEFFVEIPSSEFWENNTEAKFIICFQTNTDKRNFLKQSRSCKEFSMNCYRYSKSKVHNLWFTNMVRCRAIKTLDSENILEKFFNDGVSF